MKGGFGMWNVRRILAYSFTVDGFVVVLFPLIFFFCFLLIALSFYGVYAAVSTFEFYSILVAVKIVFLILDGVQLLFGNRTHE